MRARGVAPEGPFRAPPPIGSIERQGPLTPPSASSHAIDLDTPNPDPLDLASALQALAAGQTRHLEELVTRTRRAAASVSRPSRLAV